MSGGRQLVCERLRGKERVDEVGNTPLALSTSACLITGMLNNVSELPFLPFRLPHGPAVSGGLPWGATTALY